MYIAPPSPTDELSWKVTLVRVDEANSLYIAPPSWAPLSIKVTRVNSGEEEL